MRRKPLLVSFSGIDGAGKSTQISRLCDTLRQAGLRVKLIAFWDDVAQLKSFREDVGHKVFGGDLGVGTPEAPIRRRDKNVQSPLLTLFRMAIYVVDALSLRWVVRDALQPSSGIDVAIFDRYIYDELANVNLQNAPTRFYVRILMRLVPRPDLAFILDADPNAAFARKPEYPLDFLHANRSSYLDLSRKIGGITVIPPLSIDEVQAEILQRVMDKKNALLPHGWDSRA